MIDVTLVGGIHEQPTSDTVMSINSDEISAISSDTTGNSNARVKMKDGRTYSVKETTQELNEMIAKLITKQKS